MPCAAVVRPCRECLRRASHARVAERFVRVHLPLMATSAYGCASSIAADGGGFRQRAAKTWSEWLGLGLYLSATTTGRVSRLGEVDRAPVFVPAP